MKTFTVFFASIAAVSCAVVPFAPHLVRAPAHDSAIIRSDRLGGNFAYSVQEGHAYQAISPVVQNLRTPVAVSYSHPAVYAAPAPLLKYVEQAPESKYTPVAPVEVKYVAPAPATYVYKAPKVEIKEVKPIEIKYSEPEVKYIAAPVAPVHQIVYDAPKLKYEAAAVPEKPLVYYDAPKVEVKEEKVEYHAVAPLPYAQPAFAHAVAF